MSEARAPVGAASTNANIAITTQRLRQSGPRALARTFAAGRLFWLISLLTAGSLPAGGFCS